jgi:branched-chain amino acid transport system substrate-binding protein
MTIKQPRLAKALAGVACLSLLASLSTPAVAQDQLSGEYKVGLVNFLSGAAAGPFGIPARNAAEIVIQAINQGTVPAPYNTPGIAGARVVPLSIDENSTQVVADYRNLVERDGVGAVVGYTSSGNCAAVAPVVEDIQALTIFFDCGTPQVFESIVTEPKYLFRTGATATMDNVAAARYLLDTDQTSPRVAGINQNYAYGQDSWADFSASIEVLLPEAQVVSEQFPTLYSGQYGSEISSLLTQNPDVVHSSFWGGDMEAFVLQAAGRGIFQRSTVILTGGETAMFRPVQFPGGTVIGARGPHGVLAPDSELNTWFRNLYMERFGTWPTYPSYKMAMAVLALLPVMLFFILFQRYIVEGVATQGLKG